MVCSGLDQRKHQSSASLAFVRWIHLWPVDSSHQGPVTWRMLLCDDVFMRWDELQPNKVILWIITYMGKIWPFDPAWMWAIYDYLLPVSHGRFRDYTSFTVNWRDNMNSIIWYISHVTIYIWYSYLRKIGIETIEILFLVIYIITVYETPLG